MTMIGPKWEEVGAVWMKIFGKEVDNSYPSLTISVAKVN
jgi:hypothetical protein